MKNFLLVAVIIAAGLFFTNPGKEDFKEFIKEQAYEHAETKVEKAFLALAEGLFGVISDAFVRKNYYLFSIYELDDTRFLGIAGHFFPLEKGNWKDFTGEKNLKKWKETVEFDQMEEHLQKQADEILQEIESVFENEENGKK